MVTGFILIWQLRIFKLGLECIFGYYLIYVGFGGYMRVSLRYQNLISKFGFRHFTRLDYEILII